MELNKIFSCKLSVLTRLTIFIFSCIFVLSCEEKPLEVGRGILPPEDSLGVGIDTLKVELHTVEMESVYTRNRGTSPLGSMQDPVFGRISCEFVTDYTFFSGFDFRGGLDSTEFEEIELILKFTNTYRSNTHINFNVYKLNEAIPNYAYSDFQLNPTQYDPEKLNTESPKIDYEILTDIDGNDSITDNVIGYRVSLRDDFGESFLDPQLIADSAYYYDSIFRNHFHGLYLEVVERGEIIGGLINISHTDSRMTLKTSQTENGNVTTVDNEFVLAHPNLAGTSINMYRSDFSSTINSVLNDTVNDQNVAYMQSLVGPKVLVSIPELYEKRKEFDYRAAVTKAVLVLPIDSATFDESSYKAPQYLGIRDVLNDTNIIDDGLIPTYFGGVLDTINYEYRINLGNYIHYFLRDSIKFTDERLYLFGARYLSVPGYNTDITFFSLTTPGRVVLNSVNANRQPILRIIYSKLP